MKLTHRANDKEWIDLGDSHYTPEEYEQCMKQLARIGKYLGGDRATLQAFKGLSFLPKSIVDFGCGAGTFTIELAKRYPEAIIKGIDTSAAAINCARSELEKEQKSLNIEWIIPSASDFEGIPPCDVITSTLVCHHLSDQELVAFLKCAYKKANQAIILNDLHRSKWALLSYAMIAPLFFRNRLTIHDGLISVKKGFKRHDWEVLLLSAGIPLERCKISWHWAFRWIVRIDTYVP